MFVLVLVGVVLQRRGEHVAGEGERVEYGGRLTQLRHQLTHGVDVVSFHLVIERQLHQLQQSWARRVATLIVIIQRHISRHCRNGGT